jgi:hypothetical protein
VGLKTSVDAVELRKIVAPTVNRTSAFQPLDIPTPNLILMFTVIKFVNVTIFIYIERRCFQY